MNGTGSRSPSCSPLVRMKRIYSSGGSNSGEEQHQQSEAEKNTENEATVGEHIGRATDLEDGYSPSDKNKGEMAAAKENIAKLATDSEAVVVDGYSPSAKSEEGESISSSRLEEEQLSSENLSGQIESPTLNEDSVEGGSTSSSSEVASTPKTDTDR